MDGNYAYNYIPEMQGITDIQQRQLRNQINQQLYNLRRGMGRSNLTGAGQFYAERNKMLQNLATGLSDIAAQNLYKNALLALKERERKEAMDFQRRMAEENWRRQLELFNLQRKGQIESLIGGGLGNIFTKFINKALFGNTENNEDLDLDTLFELYFNEEEEE